MEEKLTENIISILSGELEEVIEDLSEAERLQLLATVLRLRRLLLKNMALLPPYKDRSKELDHRFRALIQPVKMLDTTICPGAYGIYD